ncbi:MAG TPA: hypothetical protein VGG94_08625, partial [Chthoniobacterales bacterium]
MDRTAWIAVVLSALGLVVWYSYMARQTVPRSMSGTGATTPAFATPPALAAQPDGTPVPSAQSTATPPAVSTPAYPEVQETLRNSDVELHLTNRGGGIAEAILVNHKTDHGAVTINAGEHTPIGAIVEHPSAPLLPEYKLTRQGDAVQCEYVSPEQLTIRKKYFFAPGTEKKDNYVGELDIDFVNGGSQPCLSSGYYLSLGGAEPIHPKDYPSYTRLVWCVNGSAKGTDVTWFAGGGGFLGLNQRAAQPFFEESIKGAEWAAVSSQFFATIIAPLIGKADSVWGRRFDIAADQKLWGIEGAMHMPAL